ncbi:MAG: SDR family oxidoreductase [Oscillospiraceae bacterium]|nr:SDR family oxidoreductase [Oscillospiraceae bacterium]
MRHTAVITGATRGIGRACAELFRSEGYDVAGLYISREDIAEDMRASGYDMYRCDVADHTAVQRTAEEIAAKGRTDVLINNAGISEQALFGDITEDMWDRMMDVGAKGAYNTIHAFLPYMIHNKYGRIINISSMWGETGGSCEVHYSAAKAAVIGLTKALAKETGPSGITVNCITPGVIDTDMNACHDEQTMRALCEETPVGRIGRPDDIARAALFLADERSDFITGQILGVNGGILI